MTETNSVHMPLLVMLKDNEKNLLVQYLKRYKHSTLAKKMALCSYWATVYKPSSFISFMSFLLYSLEKDKEPTDTGLLKSWGLTDLRYKPKFFGFDTGKIIYGNLNDVEAMITEWVDQQDKTMQYLDEIQGG